jgi:hypothetical protein
MLRKTQRREDPSDRTGVRSVLRIVDLSVHFGVGLWFFST